MKKVSLLISLIVLLPNHINAQFSFDNFINSSFERTYESLKDSLSIKKIEEKNLLGIKTIMYYDYFDPLSVSVGFLFKDGSYIGRMLANGKEDEESALKLFNKLKNLMIEKFGSKYSESSLMGAVVLTWSDPERGTIMLSKKGNGASLMLMKKSKNRAVNR